VAHVPVLDRGAEQDPPQDRGAAQECHPLHAERRARDRPRAVAAEQGGEPAEAGGQRAQEREPARHLAPVERAGGHERAAHDQRGHDERERRGDRGAVQDALPFAALSASAWYLDGHFTSSCCASKWSPWYLPMATTLTAWSKLPGITPRYSTGMTSPCSSRSLKLRNCSCGFST